MLCLSGFELYSRWVLLKTLNKDVIKLHKKKKKRNAITYRKKHLTYKLK